MRSRSLQRKGAWKRHVRDTPRRPIHIRFLLIDRSHWTLFRHYCWGCHRPPSAVLCQCMLTCATSMARRISKGMLAVGLSKSAKTKTQILMSKAQMNSVSNELRNQLSTLRIAGAMQASSAVMETMSNMICVPEMMETMRDMSVEMEKMGLIQEMVSATHTGTLGS